MKIMFVFYLLALNLAAFILYGADKKRAVRHRYRIPERVLFGTAFLGGSLGAFLGMEVFRHKTKHWKFRLLVPLFLILHLILLVWLWN